MTSLLTFLFTDLENSTGLWQKAPLAMQDALARHDAITQAAVRNHNGRIVKTTGDGLHAVFESAVDGVLAAVSMQQAMLSEPWTAETGPLRIRVGLHTGESQERAGDYYGSAVNTAARIMDLGHGGQILLSEVTVLLLRGQTSPDITFRDLGAHSLKGLTQAEEIFQLDQPDLQQDFPPLRSSSAPKHNLPVELTPLVGRESEINELSEMLLDPDQSLISIVAPGGTGKSHLALALGRKMVEQFSNGVYFVELAPVKESDGIIPALAEAVGYQFQQNGRGQQQQLLDYLANKEMLLIMDNYEHLLDGGAEIVAQLLRTASGLRILATSRARLHLPGETLFTLHGLSLPETDREDAKQSAAVELFQRSARRARPGFEITPENLPHITHICRLVYGMPLGILLAAAWVPLLSAAEIADEISQGLDVLEAEGSELPERQRSVRAVFEQAWSMMSESERDVFMKVSVFRGGFSRDAGRNVAGAGLRELQSLINKALLERGTDQGRVLTHELLRQFAAEKLQQSGVDQQVRDDHSSFYLTYLAQQTAKLKGSEQLPTLKEIEYDFKNIRAAWENAVQERDYDLIQQALEAMYLFCFLRSRLEDGKSLFEAARKGLAPPAGEAPVPVWLALGIRFFSTSGSQLALKERLEASLAQARERNDEMEVAYCLHNLGTIAHYVDQDPPQAIASYEECASIYRRLGEKYFLAQTLSKLGEAHQLIGETKLTLRYVNEAHELQRQIGDFIGESETLRALSMTVWQSGEFVEANELLEEALELQLRTNYAVGQATSNLYLGFYQFIRGNLEEGRVQVQLALDQAVEIADFSTQAWCHAILSWIQAAAGDYADAEADLNRAELIVIDPFRQTGGGNPFLQLVINLDNFLLEVVEGHFDDANGHLSQPLNLALMTASHPFMSMLPSLAALVVCHDGRPERAAELLGYSSSKSVFVNGWLAHYAPMVNLQSSLQGHLGRDEFDECWQRGETLDMQTTTRQLLDYVENRVETHS